MPRHQPVYFGYDNTSRAMTDYEIARRNSIWAEPTEFECFICAWLMFGLVVFVLGTWIAAVAHI